MRPAPLLAVSGARMSSNALGSAESFPEENCAFRKRVGRNRYGTQKPSSTACLDTARCP